MPPRHVAVLGGGITGLTSAFYLARQLPRTTRITVLEKSNRVGGWIKSFPIENSKVALEAGPRTFKGTGVSRAVVQLIHDLNLSSHLVVTPRASPAGLFRYLYLEEEGGLTLLPPTPLHFLFSSKFFWATKTIAQEIWKPPNRPEDLPNDDESFDAFLSRRFSPEISRIFGSSLVHGIYAADSRELSLQTAFPLLRHAERDGKGSMLWGLLEAAEKRKTARSLIRRMSMFDGAEDPAETWAHIKGSVAFTFMGGLEMVPRTLEARLASERNVDVRLGVGCTRLESVGDEDFKLTLSDGETLDASHVISTLPFPTLHNIISPTSISQLAETKSTSVQVLNLVFPPSPEPLHPPGFGFLVPRPKDGYPTAHTTADGMFITNLLGCVFDSSVDPNHDHKTQPTIMSLMMGGPFGFDAPSLPEGQNSTSTTLSSSDLSIYLRTLQHHLGRNLPEPTMHALHTHMNCIPTYLPGHASVNREVQAELRKEFGPKLQVIGTNVGGVGLVDSVVNAAVAVKKILQSS